MNQIQISSDILQITTFSQNAGYTAETKKELIKTYILKSKKGIDLSTYMDTLKETHIKCLSDIAVEDHLLPKVKSTIDEILSIIESLK